MDGLATLSPEQRDIAHQALKQAFGTAPVGAATRLAGGATSAAALRVEVGSRPYLLRIEGVPSPLRNPYQYQSMRIAAEAGIAPRVHYIDEAARVAVIDFIAAQPWSSYPAGQAAFVAALGQLLARLQATPTFPQVVAYPDIVTRLFMHVRRTGLFARGVLDAHVARLHEFSAAYDAGVTRLVSSHNDPVPNNILFDGTRLWLIDWESAYRNDRLVDIAIVLDTHPVPPELEDGLLQSWLGHAPDAATRARLIVVRALVRLYYAGVMLSASAAANWTRGETDLTAPSDAQLEQAMRDGILVPGTPQIRHVLGKMFLKSFLDGAPTPGLLAAI
jgi:aminoglycoside phosphotransferase (APT) family kinase protein